VSEAVISASSIVCAAGFGARQVWASARSRVSWVGKSNVVDPYMEKIRMGLVPEQALDADVSGLDSLTLPSRARRMLRLATPPLRALTSAIGDAPVALYLGLPHLTAVNAPWLEKFPEYLCERTGLKYDQAASQLFPFGRAAVLAALEAALSALASDPTRPVLVGGVDTFLDLKLLETLIAEGRVLGRLVMDGFIPGEGAAFLLLEAAGKSSVGRPVIHGAASASDPGHRYGKEPARGEGLAQALQLLRGRLSPPITSVASAFAGLNGESFDAKLWGVAQLRHKDLFDPNMALEHPASVYGDTGAATGAILTVLAATALAAGHRRGPALIWAASDFGERGCSIISVGTDRAS
jgi:3-oxoacyl-[acyl-carrier-protein] synthase I